MKIDHITAAITEAERFIERALHLRSTLVADEARMAADTSRFVCAYTFPKEKGAVRRASMDLTRALATMRGAK
jgi:hypothetical protein